MTFLFRLLSNSIFRTIFSVSTVFKSPLRVFAMICLPQIFS
jgi:hypothetical protein